MLTKFKILLIAFICCPLWAVGQESSPSTLANTWSNYKDLYEKSKAMYSSLKDNGGEEVATFKNSLEALTKALESNDPTTDFKSLLNQVQSSADAVKNNESISNLMTDVESLKNSADQAYERFGNLMDNGIVYTMPVGFKKKFGNFSIKCSLDSLRFVRGKNTKSVDDDTTLVNADLRLGLPFVTSSGDSSHIVHFSGHGIRLAGANSETKINLESNHRVSLIKDKVAIEILSELPSEGLCASSNEKTWVSFNCNGIQNMNLVGRFIFSNSFIYAASDKTQPSDASFAPGTVYANFAIHGGDFLTKVCFSDSFKVKGCGDFVFTVLDAIVDLSDSLNASGFVFPSGYWDDNKAVGLKEETWTGFFLKKMRVTLPKELDFNDNENKRGSVEFSNVLIDDYGFTGQVLLTQFVDKKSDNSGLALKIDTIGVQFWQSEFTNGLVSGKAKVPFLGKDSDKDSIVSGSDLAFRGFIGYNPTSDHFTYNASLKLTHETEFKVPFTEMASINISAGELNIHNSETSNKVTASLMMDGALNINSKLSMKGIRFEELKFSNRSPNIDVKSLSMIGTAGFSYAGVGIQLNELSWSPKSGFKTDANRNVDLAELKKRFPNVDFSGVKANLGKVSLDDLMNLNLPNFDFDNVFGTTSSSLGLGARIQLIPGPNTLAADLSIDVNSLYKDLKNWKFSGIDVGKICLDADFSAFRFAGCIERFEDDTTYGDGFRGSVEMALKELGFGIGAQACFGKVNGNHYWFAKANAEFSKTPITIFPPCVMLKSLSGGAYQHMRGKSVLDNKEKPQKINLANVGDYKPDPTMGFGFIAGVGLYIGNDNLVNANVELEMNFNRNWGVNSIKLTGLASVLTKLSIGDSVANGSIAGWLAAEYNRPARKFVAQSGVDIQFQKILTGNATMDLYTGPDGWHFYLGTNKDPNKLTFMNLASARSYFMMGKIPSHLEPMNQKVANYFNVNSSQADGMGGEVESAKGFAFGVDLHAGTEVSCLSDIFFGSFSLDGGCDLLVKEGNCGKINWRATGDTYAMADGKAGVEVRVKIPFVGKVKKKFTIISGSLYAMMQGEVPTPVYAKGTAGMKVKVLFINIPKMEFTLSVGSKCK